MSYETKFFILGCLSIIVAAVVFILWHASKDAGYDHF